MFKNIVIIGMGLMGGSLSLGIKERKLANKIIAYDKNPTVMDYVLANGLADRGEIEINKLERENFGKDNLFIIAAPLSSTANILKYVPHDIAALLTDIGSAKRHLHKIWKNYPPKSMLRQNFIPSHPIAGIEKNGVANAIPTLFEKKKCIITPFDGSSHEQIEKTAKFWAALGCSAHYMTPQIHDKLFAGVSHMPHFLSYAFVDSLGYKKMFPASLNYYGGGLRDFARISASDEKMWTDIFMVNRENLVSSINSMQTSLSKLRKLVQNKRADELMKHLKAARRAFNYIEDIKEGKPMSDVYEGAKEYDLVVSPGEKFSGEITPAADKSISHRAIMFGAIASGVTNISNLLPAEDTLNTYKIFKRLGADITWSKSPNSLKIKGTGLRGLSKPYNVLNCGNSGTSARLMCGLLSAQNFSSQLHGDTSLSARPMDRVIQPLALMGAHVYSSTESNMPILVMGNENLQAIEYHMPVPSAQIKSAIILAALHCKGETVIKGGKGSRDHTENMLRAFGGKLNADGDGNVGVTGLQELRATTITVPADISSAAFFMVLACINPGSSVLLKNVGVNPTRDGIIKILKLMGADIKLTNQKMYNAEPVADIAVSHSKLKGIDIGKELVSLAIDEMPIVMIAAAYAEGTTKISGATELRVKETDRIAAMVAGLKKLKINAKETKDGAVIEGGKMAGGKVDSFKDHRIAMSFAIGASGAKDQVQITRCANIQTSFPSFEECCKKAGLLVERSDQSVWQA